MRPLLGTATVSVVLTVQQQYAFADRLEEHLVPSTAHVARRLLPDLRRDKTWLNSF
jgi:hypothetical protein